MTAQNVGDLVRERTFFDLVIRTVGHIIDHANLPLSEKEQMIKQIMIIVKDNQLDRSIKQEKITKIKQTVDGQSK